MTEKDKKIIQERIPKMKAIYDHIKYILPVFLATINDIETTRSILVSQYLFEDQLDALDLNHYIISTKNLEELCELQSKIDKYLEAVK